MSNILIVDDDPHIRELVRVFLQNEGFTIAEAADGLAALATLLAGYAIEESGNQLANKAGLTGAVFGATILADLSGRRGRGRRLGGFRFAGDAGLIAGPLVAGVLFDRYGTGASVAAVASVLLLCAFAAALLLPETLALILAGEISKGNVLTTAQIAGMMAAKRTHELIPMCHPLLLGGIDVDLQPNEADHSVDISATVKTAGKTDVEMEALTAVTVAGLTVYDMCKAVDRGMRLTDVRLVHKSGGKSGEIVLE